MERLDISRLDNYPSSYSPLFLFTGTTFTELNGLHVFSLFTVFLSVSWLFSWGFRFESLEMELQVRVDDKMWLVKHLERTRQRVLDDLIIVKV